jgi:hypothetical protein
MKRFMVALAFGIAIFLFIQFDLLARGPGGGGRGGGGGARAGGGGGARAGGGGSRPSPAAGRSPALSGGSRSAARPSLGSSARPSGGNIGGPRPAAGNIGGARPGTGNIGAARPGAGNIGASRPVAGSIGASRPNVGAGSRPNAGQLNNFPNAPTASTGAIGAGRGGAAANFLQGGNRASQLPAGGGLAGGNRPSQLPSGAGANRPAAGTGIGSGIAAGVGAGVGVGVGRGNRPGQLPSGPGSNRPGIGNGDRLGSIADNRPSRVENRQGRQDNRQQRRGEIGNQIRENNPRLDFWLDHPNWAQWRINAPYRWATWGALAGWFGWGDYPEASYGYGENVYYGDDQVYYGDQAIATADQYADQAAGIVATAPENLDPQASDWMPLGVFALTQDNQPSGPNPTLFFQLAVNKSAVISGTLKNVATGEVKTLEGAIDKSSQRAAWSAEGKSWPIMETGLSNLTNDTVPVLVHFADGETQQLLLVRLDEPKT